MIKNKIMRGLSSYQLKLLAVIFMTLDHLGAYGFEIPVFDAYNSNLRLIGRLAMPLFLFVLTQSIRFTRNRPRFLLRLYLGAIGVGLFVTVTNYLFGDSVGVFIQSNILYTYFYVALYVTLLEGLISSIQAQNGQKTMRYTFGLLATCIPHFLAECLYNLNFMDYGMDLRHTMLMGDLLGSFFCSPLRVEYGFLFVLMGICMYFAGSKYAKAGVLVIFAGICYAGGFLDIFAWDIPAVRWLFNTFSLHFVVGYPQYYMVLAAPIMLLYNGEKGRSDKWFFYAYYPLHRYAISVAVYLYQMLG